MSEYLLNDLWWKNAVFYSLDVKTFADADGDGWGDFTGLTNRLEYLAGLGVTALWIRPFHPSPLEDDGYDVSDFYGVDPRIGDIGDFVEFVRTAKERGIRVVLDLVANHTSVQHPWFREARADPASPKHDYYVWADEPPDPRPDKVVFPDAETGIWTFDDTAGRWYLHHFYRHQPELNFANPEVREELHKLMGYWLALGVSGFRLDSVPYMIDTGELLGEGEPRSHEHLRDLRDFVGRRQGEAVLLGEADVELDELRRYFGDERGNQLHMVFGFLVNQALYLSMAREDARPLAARLESLPELPVPAHWLNFARNHDELNLAKLSEREREEVFAAFAPDDDDRIYGRGIRRRLPHMLGHDRRRLELAYSLIFALPGSPVLEYGEEIGMGDQPSLPDRLAVRTPMQWTAGASAGFSNAPPERLVRPLPGGPAGPEQVNVADQLLDPTSLLSWTTRLIGARRRAGEIALGEPRVVDTGADAVLGIEYGWQGSRLLTLHNLSREASTVTLDGWEEARLVFGHAPSARQPARLPGYGYRWLRRSAGACTSGGPP